MKYKVGDKVRIKSREWYDANKDRYGNIISNFMAFTPGMAYFCGKNGIVKSISHNDSYIIDISEYHAFNDEMLEDGKEFYFSRITSDPILCKDHDITFDNVNHPSHYTWLKDLCGIEVIDITRHMDFDLGNAIKYILRNGHKSEQGMSDKEKSIEDLKKAVFYLNDKIKMLENE